MYVLLFGLLAVASCASATPACSLDQCNQLKRGFNYFPTNAEELVEFCTGMWSMYNCQNDLFERCPEIAPKDFKAIAPVYKQLLQKLCSPSEFRSKYLRNAGCIKENQLDSTQKCCKMVQVKDPCQKADLILKCMRPLVVETCGEEAAEVNDVLVVPGRKTCERYC